MEAGTDFCLRNVEEDPPPPPTCLECKAAFFIPRVEMEGFGCKCPSLAAVLSVFGLAPTALVEDGAAVLELLLSLEDSDALEVLLLEDGVVDLEVLLLGALRSLEDKFLEALLLKLALLASILAEEGVLAVSDLPHADDDVTSVLDEVLLATETDAVAPSLPPLACCC